MVPPGIEPGFYPRQGYVLATGLWDLSFNSEKCLKRLFYNYDYGKRRRT